MSDPLNHDYTGFIAFALMGLHCTERYALAQSQRAVQENLNQACPVSETHRIGFDLDDGQDED